MQQKQEADEAKEKGHNLQKLGKKKGNENPRGRGWEAEAWNEKRCGALLLQRVQRGGTEAADGCSKWIFLVCNEATSRAAAAAAGACSVSSGRMGEGRGGRIKDEGISGENG